VITTGLILFVTGIVLLITAFLIGGTMVLEVLRDSMRGDFRFFQLGLKGFSAVATTLLADLFLLVGAIVTLVGVLQHFQVF
jgi:hypothetical protein